MAGEDVAAPRPGRPAPLWRGALLGGVCFLVGALGMFGIAWREGILGAPGSHVALDSRAPVDPTHEAPLAHVRPEGPAEATLPEPPALPPLDPAVPLKVGGSPAWAVARPGAGAPSGAPRVVVEASSAKPGVGQPVDFAARFGPGARPAKVDGALFLIAGPGIAAGTALPAADDGTGVFRTTFTFLQGGHFDVTFTARADGSPARGARPVVVGDANVFPPATPTPAAPAAEAPGPPPASANQNGGASARWL